MGFRLHVLGAGSILPRKGYGCSGYALAVEGSPGVSLLDCGPGSVRNLALHGLGVEDVRRVVFSHYHLDHCLDLFALVFARRNPAACVGPLEVYGPVGLKRLVEEAPRGLGAYAVDPGLEVHELALDRAGRVGFEVEGLAFHGAPNGHNQEALSWRVEGPGGWRLAYSGDTGDSPVVAEVARDAELFLCECSYAEGAGTDNHLTPGQAGRLAAMAGAKKLVLTHFYPGLEPEHAAEEAAGSYGGPIECAADGSVHGPD